jgi:hypothetical protein
MILFSYCGQIAANVCVLGAEERQLTRKRPRGALVARVAVAARIAFL